MTDDVRDRILGLLHAGPATVAGLATRIGVPGGVVSYHLKMLERDGLVRAGASRIERGVTVTRYVSTAAAASPPRHVPAPLPGLTWTGTGRFPIPLWTVGGEPAGFTEATGVSGPVPAAAVASHPATDDPGRSSRAAVEAGPASRTTRSSTGSPAMGTGGARPAGQPQLEQPGTAAPLPSPRTVGHPARPERAPHRTGPGPRLVEVRRIPLDDATFYEFAGRLDALAREFAGRATAGAPAAELAIALYRPPGEAAAGNGS